MLVAGAMVFMLSSCAQAKNVGEMQTDTIKNIPQNNKEADETGLDGKEYTAYGVLDSLAGEYSYASDDRTGKLIFKKHLADMIFLIMNQNFPTVFWQIRLI